jgi:hypothetical protein
MLLEPKTTSDAARAGSDFHRWIELAAKKGVEALCAAQERDEMWEVANTYLAHRPLPEGILGAEEPLYTQILAGVYLRTTFDLVYQKGSELVARDYKTFAAWPSLDHDLDFQARIYLACLGRAFPGRNVQFEHEMVRRTPPGVAHNKKGEVWSPEECYRTDTLVCSQVELDLLWEETKEVVQDLLRARRRYSEGHKSAFYREDLKGNFQGCESCFQRELCKSEAQTGHLDDQTIALLSNPRKPLEIPEWLQNEHVSAGFRP